jgi:hypothetical protein
MDDICDSTDLTYLERQMGSSFYQHIHNMGVCIVMGVPQ